MNLLFVTLVLFLSTVNAENNRTFPEGFLFGVGSSAYQIEGGWNEDEKGESIWDHWVHDKVQHVKNNDTGDVAGYFYHYFNNDVMDVSQKLGAKFFMFSISWSRILPTGLDDLINLKGVMFYQKLIDTIILLRMIPVATLYHNDLPQPLQDIGGWTNPEMVNYFTKYAEVAFRFFYKVKYWNTFNVPRSTCRLGYGEGVYPPGISLDGDADYVCAYNLIKSHAAAYHLYKEKFPDLKGKLSMAIDFEWSEPASNSTDDVEAAERRNMFEFGLYANPIYAGNWPQVVIDRVATRSSGENMTKSRLPEFTQEEIDYINGTFDFMAINMHYTNLVKDIPEPEFGDVSYMKDMRVDVSVDPSWKLASDGNPIVPWGARKTLNWLKNTYNDPEIFITGNGVPDDGKTWVDDVRINYYHDYLVSILDAMYEDNVRVFAYTAQSAFDGFEWSEGYSQHYGFYVVYVDDNGKFTVEKNSVNFFKELTKTLRIPAGVVTTAAPTRPTTTESTPTSTLTSTTPDATNRVTVYPLLILLTIFFCYLLV